MSTDNEKIKSRVRKLLNLANDSAAFDGEIQNALRFARRLMVQHNIDESDLGTPRDPHEAAADVDYSQADAFTEGENFSLWEGWLMRAVCELIGTVNSYRTHEKTSRRSAAGTLVFDDAGNPKTGTRLVFYGPMEDARDAASLFEEWSHVIAVMARLKYGGAFRGQGRSYAEGFASSLLNSLRVMREEERKEIAHVSDSRALVVQSAHALMKAKQDHARKWLEKETGIRLVSGSRRANRNDSGAFSQGATDGRNAGFSRSRTLRIGH